MVIKLSAVWTPAHPTICSVCRAAIIYGCLQIGYKKMMIFSVSLLFLVFCGCNIFSPQYITWLFRLGKTLNINCDLMWIIIVEIRTKIIITGRRGGLLFL